LLFPQAASTHSRRIARVKKRKARIPARRF
jgi:hypothetical protein